MAEGLQGLPTFYLWTTGLWWSLGEVSHIKIEVYTFHGEQGQ